MEHPVQRLFEAYLVEAWPFALMHLVVILFILRNLYVLRRERKVLGQLEEASAADHTLAAVLAQFQRDSKRLGRQGFIIPLTDFSDRLDARTEELIGGLRDLVNILLIIGIAGTMFGVFEFAAGAAGRLSVSGGAEGLAASPAIINGLAELLAKSMAKAFPVGIVGLLLTFIFQVIAGRSAQQLQNALSDATQKALQERTQHIVSPTEQLAEAAREVRESLTPLRDLQLTLSDTLQPIVESFGERLDKALQGIDQQLSSIREVTTEVKAATGSLAEGVDALSKQTGQFERLVSEIPRIAEATVALQEEARKALADTADAVAKAAQAAGEASRAAKQAADHVEGIPESVRTALRGIAEQLDADFKPTLAALEEGAQALGQAPDEITTRLQPALDAFGKRAQVSWRQASTAFVQGVQNEHIQFLTKTGSAVEQATSALKQASDDLARLATNWDKRILPAVEQTAKDVLVAQYPEALQKIKEVSLALEAAAGPVAAGTQAAEQLTSRLRNVYEALERLTEVRVPRGNGVPDTHVFHEIRDDIQKGTAVLEDIRDHAPAIAIGPFFGRRGKK